MKEFHHPSSVYTMALCTSYALMCSVQYAKLHQGYGWGSSNLIVFTIHHHHRISVMELGHLLTHSGLMYPEVSSKVCHDSFCQLGNSVSLSWVICCEAFYLHVVSSLSGIPVICLNLKLFLNPFQFVYLFCNLSKCILLFFSCISSLLLLFFCRPLL